MAGLRRHWMLALAALLVLLLGSWVRTSSTFAGAMGPGYDEELYSGFLNTLKSTGSYPEFVQTYLKAEADVPEKRVSPLRSLCLLHGWLWSEISGKPAFQSLLDVSELAGLLTLPLAGLFARRLGGNAAGVAMMAMMATAPLQVFNSHRALVDGYFSFWMLAMLWALWECLENPQSRRLPILLGALWIPVLMSKETSLFVWLGSLLVLALVKNRDGVRASYRVWLAMAVGPSLGLALLVTICGGAGPFSLLVTNYLTKEMPAYTMQHANGPWWAYLLAMLALSPLTSVLAWAGMLGEAGRERSGRMMTLFLLGALVPIACMPYQVVPRLLTLADFPLRWLCWLQVGTMIRGDGYRVQLARAILLGLICLIDFRQFYIYFIQTVIYEPTNDILLWAVKVVPIR